MCSQCYCNNDTDRSTKRCGTCTVPTPGRPGGTAQWRHARQTKVRLEMRDERKRVRGCGLTIEKGRRMYNRFMSAARPVSGFHPPNPKSTRLTQFVRTCAVVIAAFVCAASAAMAQAGTTITGTVTTEQGV